MAQHKRQLKPHETQKLKSLPSDLRSIADELIADKFGLAKSGEVIPAEKKKAKPKFDTATEAAAYENRKWYDAYALSTNTSSVTGTLTEDSLTTAMEAMRQISVDKALYETNPTYTIDSDWHEMAEKLEDYCEIANDVPREIEYVLDRYSKFRRQLYRVYYNSTMRATCFVVGNRRRQYTFVIPDNAIYDNAGLNKLAGMIDDNIYKAQMSLRGF